MKKLNNLIMPIVYIIVGLLFIIKKAAILDIICTIIGVCLIVYGVLKLIKNTKDVNSIILIVVGIVLVVLSWVFVTIVHYVLAVLFILWGVLNLLDMINNKLAKNLFNILIIVLYFVMGVLLFFNSNPIYIVIGVVLMANGILGVVSELK